MTTYSKRIQEIIEMVMLEFKHAALKEGKDGNGGIVKNRNQALAIGKSEARQA